MPKLIILGAREHAKVAWATLRDAMPSAWQVTAFLDDNPKLQGASLLGLPVAGPIARLEEIQRAGEVQGALVGVSCNHMPLRAVLHARILALGLQCPLTVSPTAHVHSTAVVGGGTLVCSGAVIHAFATVGDNCVLYSNATVEHECVLGDHVYLGPGVSFCGAVQVESGVFIGTGASVVCERIGADAIVGAGAVVVDDVPAGAIVVGAPARILRIRTPEERRQSFVFRHHPQAAA